jgi:hypothetical protein
MRLALPGFLVAAILSGVACTRAAPPVMVSTQPSFHGDTYADLLTPSRALAIAPIAIVGIIEAEKPYISAARLRLLDVRVDRVLFNVSGHPVQRYITVSGLAPSAMPMGLTEILALYPTTLRQLGIAYRPVSRYGASGVVKQSGIQYRHPGGGVYSIPVSQENTVSCFLISSQSLCRDALLATIGIKSDAQRKTYDELLMREFTGGYWWLRARDHQRLSFPTRACWSGARPPPCASRRTFMKSSGIDGVMV